MRTIDEENKKTLRKAFDVWVGLEVSVAAISSITAVHAYYNGGVGDLLQPPPTLMDLSGDGFQNDGNAIPLDPHMTGIIMDINAGTTRIRTRSLSASDVTLYALVDGVLKKYTVTPDKSGSYFEAQFEFTDEAKTKRIQVWRIVVGEAWWFNNDTLVSCSGVLRGVETTIDNPELQISEIEVQGYEPDNITDALGRIGTDYPIYYTAGYWGDMSPMRKFYLSEPIEWNDKVITFKGQDATRFLDEDFAGLYVGSADGASGGGINAYYDALDSMLTNSGVAHSSSNDYTGATYTTGEAFFLPNISKRTLIAQAVNTLHGEGKFFDGVSDQSIPLYFHYVDAGIPRLWTTDSLEEGREPIRLFGGVGRPSYDVSPLIKQVTMNQYFAHAKASKEIKTDTYRGVKIESESDPYYSFSTSAGTITKLSPYSYKIRRQGSATISGRALSFEDEADFREYQLVPTVITDPYGEHTEGIDVEIDDFFGLQVAPFSGGLEPAIKYALQDRVEYMWYYNYRYNRAVTFEYRGDPRLQPRDCIEADIYVSGAYRTMTIDSIEFSHEDGGYKQTITAREGIY